ncbi:LysR family transcriptional regulator [Frateuria defendens]|uniref:LysR family transcriptional regulator n=1 Tax=Frateuria defendens TaxID=2219559 RepID=UPI00066FD691|nr:LysR family transcriptional regulator [Frateuria defendens]
MSQLEDMRLFVETLDAASFTAAAERLGLSKQFVSKRVMALEDRLGVRLLNRTTRKLRATELGLAYYERARQILEAVEDAEQTIARQNAAPRGTLRLSAPMSFGTMHLSPAIPRFLAAHTEVAIELDLNDRTVDLVGEGYDMAVRIGTLADSSLIARNIAPVEVVTCASPDYLARRGAPRTPEALRQYDCLLYGHGKSVEWPFTVHGKTQAFPVTGRLLANNGEVVRDAAIAGLGLVHLPTFIVGEALRAGQLATVLDDYRPPVAAIYAVYPQHRQSSLAIHAFVDFLRSTFAVPAGGIDRAR